MSEHQIFLIALAIVVTIMLWSIAPLFWKWLLSRGPHRRDALRFGEWCDFLKPAIAATRDAIDRGDKEAAHAALDRIAGVKL